MPGVKTQPRQPYPLGLCLSGDAEEKVPDRCDREKSEPLGPVQGHLRAECRGTKAWDLCSCTGHWLGGGQGQHLAASTGSVLLWMLGDQLAEEKGTRNSCCHSESDHVFLGTTLLFGFSMSQSPSTVTHLDVTLACSVGASEILPRTSCLLPGQAEHLLAVDPWASYLIVLSFGGS